MIFNENSGFYLYSSLLQVTATLIGFFSLLLIYKLQEQKASIDVLKTAAFSLVPKDESLLREIMKFNLMITQRKHIYLNEMSKENILRPIFSSWVHHAKKMKYIKRQLVMPTFFSALILIATSFLLLFNSTIVTNFTCLPECIAFFVLFFNAVLWIYLFCTAIYIIKNLK